MYKGKIRFYRILITYKVGEGDSSTKVKLPKIELPTFTGAYDEWVQFYKIFTSLIDSNDTLPAVEKFYYLKSCLKREAGKDIHSLELSSENYKVALGLLKTRFENKRVIVQKYVKCLCDAPLIVKESYIQLRKLVDEVQKNIRHLNVYSNQWISGMCY